MKTYGSDLEEITNAMTTQTPPQLDDFDQARALILSYFNEDTDDARLPQALTAVRDTCGINAFHRVLVLAAAIGDPRFDEFGAADVLPLLRNLEISDDFSSDLERLLEAMRLEDGEAERAALREAAEELNPYRRAAIRLLKKFREPNIHQIMYELTKL